MAAAMRHGLSRKLNEEEEEEDPIEAMISKTGCAKYHYAVQDCMAEHQDWRKCQEEVLNFRKCIADSRQIQSGNS